MKKNIILIFSVLLFIGFGLTQQFNRLQAADSEKGFFGFKQEEGFSFPVRQDIKGMVTTKDGSQYYCWLQIYGEQIVYSDGVIYSTFPAIQKVTAYKVWTGTTYQDCPDQIISLEVIKAIQIK